MDTNFKTSVQLTKSILNADKIPCLLGPPSTGKTSAAKVAAKELERPSFTVPTVTLDVVDVKGLPVRDGDRTRFLPMDRFFEDAVIILDEFLQARPSVKLSMLDMLDTRQVGGFQLPKNTRFILTGNRMQDDCGVESIPKHLANRFAWINCRPSTQEWIAWAWSEGVHPDCIRAVEMDRTILDGWAKASEDPDATAFCTPRSLTNLSSVLLAGKIAKDMLMPLATSFIGKAAASVFIRVMKNREEVIEPSVLLDDPGLISGLSLSGQYFCLGSCIRYCTENRREVGKLLEVIDELDEESKAASIANVAASAAALGLNGSSKSAEKFRDILIGSDVQAALNF